MHSKFSSSPCTYKILYGGLAIQCFICGLISYNPHYIIEKYCGHCFIFHEIHRD